VAERFAVQLARTSISPALRRMEQAGDVEHVDNAWRWIGQNTASYDSAEGP
jgi:hypothetical protein